MQYFHLERQSDNGWISTGILLGGDFHEHMKLMEHLRLEHNCDFRAKPIAYKTAECLYKQGMCFYTKL